VTVVVCPSSTEADRGERHMSRKSGATVISNVVTALRRT
jgi:hypothetical protein